MPALQYFFRDPATHDIRQATADEVSALVADTKKPVFFSCLGRDGFSGKTEPFKQVGCIEGFFDGHKPEDGYVIAIVSGEKMTDTKLTNYMHRFKDNAKPDYHTEHDAPTTFGMQFLKDVIEPAIPYAGWTSDAEHAKLLAQTKVKLSQYNFFAHSLGTVVLSETFGHMEQMLQQKGYTADEARDCLNCMGKLNVGNPYHITEEHSKVPGVDFNSALDRRAEAHNNIPQTRDSQVLVIDRIGESLQLCPLIGSDAVNTISLKATPDATPEERKSFTTKYTPGAGKPSRPDPWELVVGDVSDPSYHALQLYMYKDRTRLDPANGRARSTSQAYPGAEVANRYMVDLFESSAAAASTGKPRDTREIVARMHEELSPPSVRDALGASLKATQDRFDSHFSR